MALSVRGLSGLETAKAKPVTEARVRKLIAEGGGGSGGSTAWGDVTGKPSTFPPSTHSHAISDVTGLEAALAGAGGLSGGATLNLATTRYEHTETVAATGVTGSKRINVWLDPAGDADENVPEMLDIMAISAAPGTAQITVTAAFATPTRGPIKIQWSAF